MRVGRKQGGVSGQRAVQKGEWVGHQETWSLAKPEWPWASHCTFLSLCPQTPEGRLSC